MKVRVYHASYGCDTGCCGHIVEVDGKAVRDFSFDHPNEWPESLSARDFIIALVTNELGADHVKDIDWNACEVSDN